MGYRSKDEFIAQLENGALFASMASGTFSLGQFNGGNWIRAFPDNITARFGSAGILDAYSYEFDPARNYTDLMAPQLAGFTNTVGPEGDIWFSTTEVRSGDKSLWFRNTTSSVIGTNSPIFRIQAGRTYRVTVTWKSAGAVASLFVVNMTTFTKTGGVGSSSSTGSLAGTGNVWQTNSFTHTPSATPGNEAFGTILAQKNQTGDEVFIDEIKVQEVPVSFQMYGTVGTSVTGTVPINYNTMEYDYSDGGAATGSPGTFTCKAPGLYHFNAVGGLLSTPDTVYNIIWIQKNAANIKKGNVIYSSVAGANLSCVVSCEIVLARADVVRVAMTPGSGTLTTDTGQASNYFSGYKVG